MNAVRGKVALFEERPRSRLILQIRRGARYLQKGLTSRLSTEEASQLHGEYPERVFGLMAQLLRLCELSSMNQDEVAGHFGAWESLKRDDASLPTATGAFERALADIVLLGRIHDPTDLQEQELHAALGKAVRSGAEVAVSVGLSARHFSSWVFRDMAEAA
jgi:hypothetical protein